MKRFKKLLTSIISMVLVIAMVGTSCVFADTSEPNGIINTPDDSIAYVESVDDYYVFDYEDAQKRCAILSNYDGSLIDISIKYNNSNLVYQWVLVDYSASRYNPYNYIFWNDIINYAENHLELAETVIFESVTYDAPINVTDTKGSVIADLKADLATLSESNEYYNRLLTPTPYYRNGYALNIYEDLQFSVFSAGFETWSTPITITSLIVTILGLATNSGRVKLFATIFGIAVSALSLIPAGRIDRYVCSADLRRRTHVNNYGYAYNMTDRIVTYTGYDDHDTNSTTRARIDNTASDVYYSHSFSYFYSYPDQVDDAYNKFLQIGPM